MLEASKYPEQSLYGGMKALEALRQEALEWAEMAEQFRKELSALEKATHAKTRLRSELGTKKCKWWHSNLGGVASQ